MKQALYIGIIIFLALIIMYSIYGIIIDPSMPVGEIVMGAIAVYGIKRYAAKLSEKSKKYIAHSDNQ